MKRFSLFVVKKKLIWSLERIYGYCLHITRNCYESATWNQAIAFFSYPFNSIIVLQQLISLLQSPCGRYYCCNFNYQLPNLNSDITSLQNGLISTSLWIIFFLGLGTATIWMPDVMVIFSLFGLRCLVNMVCATWSCYMPWRMLSSMMRVEAVCLGV